MPRRWITPIATTTAPTAVVAVAYDPVDTRTDGSGYVTTAGGWSVTGATRTGRDWHRDGMRYVAGRDTDGLWRIIDAAGRDGRRTHVVCRCASDALTLAGLWGRVDRGECRLRLASDHWIDRDGRKRKRRPLPLILSGTPDVIGWTVGRSEYRATSITNHVPIPLLDAARAAGVPDPPPARLAFRPTGHAEPDSAWTAGALLSVFCSLASWWLDRRAGSWSDTLGAGAWQWWRRTLGEREVLEHDQPSAMAMERAAIHGGRAQLFWFGSAGADGAETPDEPYLESAVPVHLPGPAYKLDIRSMYVSILESETFPTRLAHRLRCRTPDKLRAACDVFQAVATVGVRLSSPRLPFSDPERGTVWPTGRWTTTLTTPEIIDTYERGELETVGEAWAYVPGRPFRRFAHEVLESRAKASDCGDELGKAFTKALGNALGGRLARTFRGWSRDGDRLPRQPWGEWVEIDADTGESVRWRGVAGVRQRFVTRDERAGGLAAMFAHLTAYGRVRLARVIDTAGRGNVLWCDTDGVIVTADGKDRLAAAGQVAHDTPGMLRIVEEVRRFSGRTPKHYHTDKGWTLAGARGDFSALDGHKVRCYLTANPVRSGLDPSGRPLLTVAPVYALDAIPLAGRPGLDGWLIDPVADGGTLVQPADPDAGTESALDG